MAITYTASSSDMARLRLAPSPIGEAVTSLRAIGSYKVGSYNAPFVRYARQGLKDIDVRFLQALVPSTGYVPDVLTLAPRFGSSFRSQMEEFRALPPNELAAQVSWMASDPGTSASWKAQTAYSRSFVEQHPERAMKILSAQLETYWHAVLEPHWQRIVNHLNRDIRDRTAIAERSGTDLMLSSINPQVHWDNQRLAVRSRYEYTSAMGGGGIILVPSVFSEAEVLTMLPPMVPMMVYPRPVASDLWSGQTESVEPLVNLLGRIRAHILRLLFQPMTTGDLARTVGVTAGAVSQHVTVLRESGLATSEKRGRNVFHILTQAGEDLITAARVQPSSR